MHNRFSDQLEQERRKHGWSQEYIAEQLEVDPKTVGRWLSGRNLPQISLRNKIAELMGRTIEDLGLLGDSNDFHPPTRKEATGVTRSPYPDEEKQPSTATEEPMATEKGSRSSWQREDWGEAPLLALTDFYGRERELQQLSQWTLSAGCHIIALTGIGGLGKSSLAVQLVTQLKDSFDYVFWRSLQDAPPLSQFLRQCMLFLSHQELTRLPGELDEQLLMLHHCLQQNRCLLVLDNVESIMQAEQRVGVYRDGYENYGRLFQAIAQMQHTSCLLLTTRELPAEIALLASDRSPIRFLPLSGIGEAEGAQILQAKGATGSREAVANLVATYSGNPLALKIIASSIQSVFDGNVDRFLQEKEFVFGDLTDLLHRQFSRLSAREKEIMCWLAIERESVTLADLRINLISLDSQHACVETLDSLLRRSMIERVSGDRFALQPVIMEYVTVHLIQLLFYSFGDANNAAWVHYALLKAQAKDYVRENQRRLILEPLAQRLLARLGTTTIEEIARAKLTHQRQLHRSHHGYLASNMLHLLISLALDLRRVDFSALTLRQAYLQGVVLPGLNVSRAHMIDPILLNTFGNVATVVFDPSGDLLATGTTTGEVWLYLSRTGTPLRICRGHTDTVWSVAFDSSGQLLASGSDDRTVCLWEVSTGRCLGVFQQHTGRVRSVAFHPREALIASGDEDCIIHLWHSATGELVRTLRGHEGRVWSIAFSPDGQLLATGSMDRTIRLWDVSTGSCLRVLQGHTHWIRAIAFHPDGNLLLSGGDDQTVRLWDVNSGRCLHILRGHSNHVWSVACSPTGYHVASAGEDGLIRVWSIETYHYLVTLQGHAHGIRSVAFSPDGHRLASGGDDQALRLWDITTGQCLQTIQGYTNRVWSVAFGPKEHMLLSCGEDRLIRLWHAGVPQCIRTYQTLSHSPRAIASSADGQTFISGGEDNTVRLWERNTGQCLRTFEGHSAWVRAVAIRADGTLLASGGEDHTIRLWETSSGQCLHILPGHTNWVRALAFDHEGTLLASGGDDHSILLWESETGHRKHTLSGHTGKVRSLAFGSHSDLLASSGEDQTVRLWQVSSGRCLNILKGHSNWVRSVAFSPDGHLLASGSDDCTIRLWNVDTGQHLETIHAHNERIRWVAFDPHGQLLASCSDDGTIQLYQAPTYRHRETLINERPYEGMNITGIQGLTDAQKEALHALGAFEDE